MIVTTAWMETWFHKFNDDYFGSGLPLPILKTSTARTRLGQMSCKRTTRWGRTKYYDFTIKLTTYYDMTERQAQNVLLHEMIHYSIAYTGLKDTAPHGVVFRGIADKLNRQYGWNIKAMTTTKGWKKAESAKTRTNRRPVTYLILALKMKNNRHFLSVVNPRYAHQIDHQLGRLAEVERYGWYASSDTAFDRMPVVRSLRGKRVTQDEYENKLAAMRQVLI
ncbi:SprT-like domain-containing protein [Prevotella sp. A2931]|uniref:SprT-like domain-containing protein n=1 Tax=Prevotella illustrans TaxID=2800387 RepID=A0ABS3M462_9BACT|nr:MULTISPECIES: SprT-like domain-containing protein [Prevotella]MBO1362905.1 SprT-like domain-containing protein [Prevotella illustrans]PTL27185.1 sprT domain-containing protein [Prevotella sp. oral taxon 820]